MGAGVSKDDVVRMNEGVTRITSSQIPDGEGATIQKRVLQTYPWLGEVWESMLITDLRLPDNPIVFANDDFERMTLYPKAEIIGRNCRFLQGTHTNRETVARIAEAVKKREKLEVELLNYRRDGTPFWNCFLLLPLSLKKKGPTTHYIAVQKDITVIKREATAPVDWTTAEVAMWLEDNGFEQHATAFIRLGVDGTRLLALKNDTDLRGCGVAIAAERLRMLQLLSRVRDNAERPPVEWADSSSAASSQGGGGGAAYEAVALGGQVANTDFDAAAPKQLAMYDRAATKKRIVWCAVKITHVDTDTVLIMRVRRGCSLRRLATKARHRFKSLGGTALELYYFDEAAAAAAQDAAAASAAAATATTDDGKKKKGAKKAAKAAAAAAAAAADAGWQRLSTQAQLDALLATGAEHTVQLRISVTEAAANTSSVAAMLSGAAPATAGGAAAAATGKKAKKGGKKAAAAAAANDDDDDDDGGDGGGGGGGGADSSFAGFFMSTALPLMLLDASGNLVASNDATCDAFGYAAGPAAQSGLAGMRVLHECVQLHSSVPQPPTSLKNDRRLLGMLADGTWPAHVITSADDGELQQSVPALVSVTRLPATLTAAYCVQLLPLDANIAGVMRELQAEAGDDASSSVSNTRGHLNDAAQLLSVAPVTVGGSLEPREREDGVAIPGYK